MTILAVDPGKSGCLCVYHGGDSSPSPPLLEFFDTPTYKKATSTEYDLPEIAGRLLRIVKENGGDALTAVIEQVSGRPGEGTVSARSIGYGAGIWHMAFTIFGIPYEKVAPQTWKKAFGLIGAEKKASIAVAKQRFPSASLDRARDHNRADALLMALWLWDRKR